MFTKPQNIPENPGVYQFLDKFGTVLYVGKAKNLKKRVSNYFDKSSSELHGFTGLMMQLATKVQWTIVRSNLEALTLEYTWIKELKPRYNIIFNDDKSYATLAISLNEQFPKAFITRVNKRQNPKWKYFGPFPFARNLHHAVNVLLDIYPLRTCSSGVLNSAIKSQKPCLKGYIDKCCAPCVKKVSKEEYNKLVENFMQVWTTYPKSLIKELEESMKNAAKHMDYENAAKQRDKLNGLKSVLEKNTVLFSGESNFDVLALREDELQAVLVIFQIRCGLITAQHSLDTQKFTNLTSAQVMEELIMQFYFSKNELNANNKICPSEILVSEEPTNINEITQLLSGLANKNIKIKIPKKGSKALIMQTVIQNAKHNLEVKKLSKFESVLQRTASLNDLQYGLKMAASPLRIECFDISHTGFKNQVASMVVFEDGIPNKKEYRKFIIKNDDGLIKDDTAAMAQVLKRRLLHGLQDEQFEKKQEGLPDGTIGKVNIMNTASKTNKKFSYSIPNLIIVDGGIGQVNAAKRVFDELGISTENIFLVGLAKRLEEVWLPFSTEPIVLKRDSLGLFLIQRIRDEAHRFAITLHRKRRSKDMLNLLDEKLPKTRLKKTK